MRLLLSRQLFKEYSYIKFHEYPSGGRRFVARNKQNDRRTNEQRKVLIKSHLSPIRKSDSNRKISRLSGDLELNFLALFA